MSRANTVPDAWDDDEFEAVADAPSKGKEPANPKPEVKGSKAERRAKHVEANKQLWEAAENPETFHYLEARHNVPLKSEFKPTVQVLSRKPKPDPKTSSNLQGGMNNLSIKGGDDSEEEEWKAQQASLAERQEKARLERIEKEKRYAEVRERLFGSQTPTSDDQNGRASPTTSMASGGRARQSGRGNKKGVRNVNSGRTDSNPTSSTDQSPVRGSSSPKQLFDPNNSEKPGSVYHQRRNQTKTSDADAPDKNRPIRNPRGPDGSGRGGFGFGQRGTKAGT